MRRYIRFIQDLIKRAAGFEEILDTAAKVEASRVARRTLWKSRAETRTHIGNCPQDSKEEQDNE